jgi:cytochrome c biogenesis factor
LATVGSALLLLVLALVTYATVASVLAGLRRDRRLMRSAGNAVMAAFVCTVSAVVLLEVALVRHDFSIAVVLQHLLASDAPEQAQEP